MSINSITIRNRQILILLGCITFLSMAFLCLNFRIATSNTKSEKNVISTNMGDRLPDAMQNREKINLVVIGDSPLIPVLQKSLVVAMNKAGVGDIELVKEFSRIYQGPVLVIDVAKPALFWTPFFSTSQFTIKSGYASNGDTNFMRQTPVTVNIRGEITLLMYGEYKVRDHSWGLISRLGYYQTLADYIAEEIVGKLKDLYKVST